MSKYALELRGRRLNSLAGGKEPETKVQTTSCASLEDNPDNTPMLWCYWLRRGLDEANGEPVKPPDCPIVDLASHNCRVGVRVAFHSYQMVQKELGGLLLNDGVEIDAEEFKRKLGVSGGIIQDVLELRETPPTPEEIFPDEKTREANMLGLLKKEKE